MAILPVLSISTLCTRRPAATAPLTARVTSPWRKVHGPLAIGDTRFQLTILPICTRVSAKSFMSYVVDSGNKSECMATRIPDRRAYKPLTMAGLKSGNWICIEDARGCCPQL